MNKKIAMIIAGIILITISFASLASGVIWPWGWGTGAILLLFAIFGDSSTPQNDPKSISKSYKNNFSGDFQKAAEVISTLSALTHPWTSKNSPDKLRDKILNMKNMATASITFTHGNSLITKLKLSFTKSKDSYMISIVGEGQESLNFIENKLGDI